VQNLREATRILTIWYLPQHHLNMSYQLYVFGSNGEGQLGLPPAEIVNTPTLVPNPSPKGYTLPLDDLKTIRGGDNHTVLFTKGGAVYGAGDNRKKQLKVDPRDFRLDGFQLMHLGNTFGSRVKGSQLVGLGDTFVAATCESSAYIKSNWMSQESYSRAVGAGNWGELGPGPGAYQCEDTLPGVVVDFAAGVWHYIAIMLDGSVYGWGKARLGQLGDGLSGKVTTATKIENIPFKPRKVVCAKDFTYLVGDSSTGEHTLLGKDKFNIISNMPDHVKGWKDIGATWHAVFVLFDDGILTAWGKENMWQLLPPNVPLLEKIAVGSDHILALTKDGKLISWGWGKHGNCGDLSKIKREVKNDMVSGSWNEIDIPGEIEFIGAGYCTSFVTTK
jgi:protein ATS1